MPIAFVFLNNDGIEKKKDRNEKDAKHG